MVDAVVLLGWMKQDAAVAFLRDRCLFPSHESAVDLWSRHRQRVEDLPERPASLVQMQTLTPLEEDAAARFLSAHRRPIEGSTSIVKVDSRALNIRQLGVTLNRCNDFERRCQHREEWIEQWLNPASTSIEGRVRGAVNHITIEVPHPEFVLGFDSELGFRVIEAPRYVTIRQSMGSTLLFSGYHRTYAYLTSPGGRLDPTIVGLASHQDGRGAEPVMVMDGAEDVCATRPPRMEDFLDPTHAVRLKMRPARYELHIRARMAVVAA